MTVAAGEPSTTGLITRAWAAASKAFQELRYAEPATLKARWTMILGVLATAGVTLPGWVDQRVGVLLAAFAIVAPWLQGKRTRADVWSPQTVDELAELVALFPGFADEARRLLAAGLSYRIVRGHLEGLTLRSASAARAADAVATS